ncbi:MAG TPA: hypothetical protein VE870_04260, partial [Bacteroidales bacterium]|nr:hypothetical protein [Bacteroidales bacterium]
MKIPTLLSALFLPVMIYGQATVKVNADFSGRPATENHFWRSTGFTPAAAILRPDMQITLDHLGATAGSGIVYVRPHYMLNLVGMKGAG